MGLLLEQEDVSRKEDDVFLQSVWLEISKCPSPVCKDNSNSDSVFSGLSTSVIVNKSQCKDIPYESKLMKVQKKRTSTGKLSDLFSNTVKRKDKKLLKKIKKNKIDMSVGTLGRKSKKKLKDKSINSFPSWHTPIKHPSKPATGEGVNCKLFENDKSSLSPTVDNSQPSDKNEILSSTGKIPALDVDDEKTLKRGRVQDNKTSIVKDDLKSSQNIGDILSKNKITISCKKFSEISSFSNEDLNLQHQQLLLDEAQLRSTQHPLKTEHNINNHPQIPGCDVTLANVNEPPKRVSNGALDKSLDEVFKTENPTGGKIIDTGNNIVNTIEVVMDTSYKSSDVIKLSSKTNINDIKEPPIDKERHVENINCSKSVGSYSDDIKEPTSPTVLSSETLQTQSFKFPLKTNLNDIKEPPFDKERHIENINYSKSIDSYSGDIEESTSPTLSASEPLHNQSEPPDICISNQEKINSYNKNPSKTIPLFPNSTMESNEDAKIKSVSSECMMAKPTCTFKSNYSIEHLLSPNSMKVNSENVVNSCEFKNAMPESKVLAKKELFSNTTDHKSKSIDEPLSICTVNVATGGTTKTSNLLSQHLVLTKGQIKESPVQHSPMKIGTKQRLSSETNKCLLHSILGEGDCLTNPHGECLMENRNVVHESTADGNSAEKVSVERIKQQDHSHRSSNLFKDEEVYDFRKFDCIEEKKAFDEARARSLNFQSAVEQESRPSRVDIGVPKMGDIGEYRYRNNITLNDSESEDSNLVIDEDVGSPKELNEPDTEEANLAVRSMSDIIDKLMSNKQLLDACEAGQRDSENEGNNLVNLRLHNLSSEISKENMVLKNEMLTRYKLVPSPVIFGNISTAVNKSPKIVSPGQKNAKSTSKADGKGSATLPREESLLLKSPNCSNQYGIPTANVKLVGLKPLSAKPASPKVVPTSTLPQGNLTFISGNPLESTPTQAQRNPNMFVKTDYSNYHPVKTPLNNDGCIVIGKKVLPLKNTVILTPKDAARHESYYHSKSILSLANNKNIQPMYKQGHQSELVGSAQNQSLNTNLVMHENPHHHPVASIPYQSPKQNPLALGKTHSAHPVASTPYQSPKQNLRSPSASYHGPNQNLVALGKTHSAQPVASTPYQIPNQNLRSPSASYLSPNQNLIALGETHCAQPVSGAPDQITNQNGVALGKTSSYQPIARPLHQSLNNNFALPKKIPSPLGPPKCMTNKADYVNHKVEESFKPNYVDQPYSSEQNVQRNLRPNELMRVNPHIPPDPLCLVKKSKEGNKREIMVKKSKEGDGRETTSEGFFDLVLIGQEVEVQSALGNESTDSNCTRVSEIVNSVSPLGNEQNIDICRTMVDPHVNPSRIRSDQIMSENNQPLPNQWLDFQEVTIDNIIPPQKFETILQKELFDLHVTTVNFDYSWCSCQLSFQKYIMAEAVPPTIPIPCPPPPSNDGKLVVRCQCKQCSDNLAKLLSNCSLLTIIQNSTLKPSTLPYDSHLSFLDNALSDEWACSLPLKKRKTLTNVKLSEKPETLSYPNIPMISIAQLADYNNCQQQLMVPNPQGRWKDQATDLCWPAPDSVHLLRGSSLQETILDRQTRLNKRKPTKRRKTTR